MGNYDNSVTYRRLDWVYYGGTSYICKKNDTFGIVPSNTERWQKIIESPTEINIIFDESTTRDNIISGEKLSVILGKIARFFKDLKTIAFTGSYNDLSDKPNSLKSPNSLNIKLNGTSQTSYDGSTTKEVNITPAGISAVNTSTVLTTKEQISANTNANNVTGALVAKSLILDISQINSNLANIIKIQTTQKAVNVTLPSMFGKTFKEISGNDFVVTAPEGYKLLANVDTRVNGSGGLQSSFDGNVSVTNMSLTPNLYLFNGFRNEIANALATVYVTSVFIKSINEQI